MLFVIISKNLKKSYGTFLSIRDEQKVSQDKKYEWKMITPLLKSVINLHKLFWQVDKILSNRLLNYIIIIVFMIKKNQIKKFQM